MNAENNKRNQASGEFVTYNHFSDLAQEMRNQFKEVNNGLASIHKQLIEGAGRFKEAESKITECTERSDEHSSKLKVLEEERIRREEREGVQAATSAPRNALVEEVRRTVVTAAVLGSLAIFYNVWRDHEVSKEVTARTGNASSTAPAAAAPPKPAPSPAPVPTSPAP